MSKIAFNLIPNSSSYSIEIGVVVENHKSDNGNYTLNFDFNISVKDVDKSLIAVAMSTVCGRGYENVTFGWPVRRNDLVKIGDMCKAVIDCDVIEEERIPRAGGRGCLLFSGGFDSLAALALLPSNTCLLSIDFGGRFARERQFFEGFFPCIMKTNLIDTPFRKNSWSFMGIPAIILSERLSISHYSFGGILEASPINLKNNNKFDNPPFPPFSTASMSNFPVTLGLTEVATTLISAKYKPDMFISSLESLASPGEEKFFRKRILANIASKRFGLELPVTLEINRGKPHFVFGESKVFSLDFLVFYMLKYTERHFVESICSGIPDEVFEISKTLHLNFYERYNPSAVNALKGDLGVSTRSKLNENGVLPYDDNDWVELRLVTKFLSKYYEILN